MLSLVKAAATTASAKSAQAEASIPPSSIVPELERNPTPKAVEPAHREDSKLVPVLSATAPRRKSVHATGSSPLRCIRPFAAIQVGYIVPLQTSSITAKSAGLRTCSVSATLEPSSQEQEASCRVSVVASPEITVFPTIPSKNLHRPLAIVSAPSRAAVTYGRANSPA